VNLTGGYAPRFQAFSLAQARSVKVVLSCPSRQQVTQTVGLPKVISMSNYESIVRAYISRIRPHAKVELDWFREQPSLDSAIELASLAVNSKGKRHPHQRRLKKANLLETKSVLSANSRVLKKCRDFEELFLVVEAMLEPISGIGELYVYDTALRIGARLGLLPKMVYLHAGTRVGAKVLGFDGKAKALEISVLPKEFRRLEPYEIEDLLCIFKSELSDESFINSDKVKSKRSRCEGKKLPNIACT